MCSLLGYCNLYPYLIDHSLILDWVLWKDLSKFNSEEVIYMIMNRLSIYAYFMALTNPYTTSIVAKTFIENVYKLHDLLAIIVNDWDTMFF
jgi:hypothetical protein